MILITVASRAGSANRVWQLVVWHLYPGRRHRKVRAYSVRRRCLSHQAGNPVSAVAAEGACFQQGKSSDV